VTAAVAHRPLFRSAPAFVTTNGDLAARVGEDMGLTADPEQRWLLDQCFGETEDGLPSAPDVCVVGPRQTVGKTAALEVAALTDLYALEVELHVWTAHEFKTARKAYLDMRKRIEAHPDYAAMTTYRDSHGEEAIITDSGAIEFHARSGGSGRGFTTRRITLDEALYLQPGDLGALVPTGVTQPDFQVRYGSSAGLLRSAALRQVRNRGRAGDPGLAYLEFGVERRPCALEPCPHEIDDPGCALNDRDLWVQANSGMWYGRVTEQAMERQRRSLPAEEFMREFFSWWEDPPEEESTGALDFERWKAAKDPGAERGRAPAFGVATAPDRSWSAIGVAWLRPDGAFQVSLVDYKPGAAWVSARADELRARWGGPVAVDAAADGLVEGGVKASQTARARADNALSDALESGRLRHGDEAALNTAARAARWRPMGDTRVLDAKGSVDVSPLRAVSLAIEALTAAADPGGWMISVG